MTPASNATTTPHLPPARANPTAAVVAVAPLPQVPQIPVGVDTALDTTGDARTVLIITGAVVPHPQEATTAIEVLLEAVVVGVALLPPPQEETATDHRRMEEAVVALLLMTVIVVVVVVVMAPILLQEVRTVELQILTVVMVDHLPSRRARAAATLLQGDLPVVEMTPVDLPPILPR